MAFSHNVKYFNTLNSTFCSLNSAEDQVVYSDASSLGVSNKVYYNSALTQPVTGYEYIKFGGNIYEMNFDTGEINNLSKVQCPIPDVYIYRISIPPNTTSHVRWRECDGDTFPVKELIYDKMRTIDVQAVENSVSASSEATITIVGNCVPFPDCICTYIVQPTTTTTTLAPIDFTLSTSCEGLGLNGDGKITATSFSGGSGVYQSIGIGNSALNAFNATPTNLSGATTFDFTSLTNGVWYVILRDNTGAYAIKSIAVNCTNTTTTTSTSTTSTSTTSTTTAAAVCTYNGGSAVVTYDTTTTTTTAAPTTTTTAAPTTTTTTAPETTTTTTTAPETTTTTSTSTSTTTTEAPTTTTTTATPPVSSTLSCTFFGNSTGNSIFKFTLSDALTVPLTINAATVNLFNDFSCTSADGTASTSTSGTITAGNVEVDIDGTSGVCPLTYQLSGGINITGVGFVTDGSTFTLGGTLVTLNYPNGDCSFPICIS